MRACFGQWGIFDIVPGRRWQKPVKLTILQCLSDFRFTKQDIIHLFSVMSLDFQILWKHFIVILFHPLRNFYQIPILFHARFDHLLLLFFSLLSVWLSSENLFNYANAVYNRETVHLTLVGISLMILSRAFYSTDGN